MEPFNSKSDPFDYINAPSTRFEVEILPIVGKDFEYDWQDQDVCTPNGRIPFKLSEMDTLPTEEIVRQITRSSKSYDHVEAWLQRKGNLVFIGDEMDFARMNQDYYFASIDDHEKNCGLTEAAIWWM